MPYLDCLGFGFCGLCLIVCVYLWLAGCIGIVLLIACRCLFKFIVVCCLVLCLYRFSSVGVVVA